MSLPHRSGLHTKNYVKEILPSVAEGKSMSRLFVMANLGTKKLLRGDRVI